MKYIKSLLLLLSLLLAACNNSKTQDASSEMKLEENQSETIRLSKAQFQNAQMEIGQLTNRPFSETVQTTGMLDVPPQSRAIISAFSGGYIKNTPLLIGNKVRKGQRLVTLENPEFIVMQQNYLETVEQLSYLKSEYDRQKTMFEENITSQKSFLKAESDFKTASARSVGLKKNLEMLNINPSSVIAGNIVSQVNVYSPIDGNVTEVYVNTGTFVSPADKIMEIMNIDHIHLELKVFEKDLLQLKKGQDILFTVPEASSTTFKGEVHLVGTFIDPSERVALIHGHIEEKQEQNLTAGMFVVAEIITGTSAQMALPENAVVELDGRYFVLLIENENDDAFDLHPMEVKVGAKYQSFIAIENAEEFKADSRFISKGAFVLLQEEVDGGHGH